MTTMAPEPSHDGAPDEEDEGAAAAPMVQLRFYPTNTGSDDEDDSNDQFFEDAYDVEDVDFQPRPSTLKSGSEKTVKFADEIHDETDALRDKDRTRKELLAKIARLTDMLKDAEKAIEVEKEKRKKKEKNLLKLAKELKKRNQKRESDLERMEEVRHVSAGCKFLREVYLFPDTTFFCCSWRKRNATWNITGSLRKRNWIKRRYCEQNSNRRWR